MSEYFPSDPASVGDARRLVAATLDASGIDPDIPVVIISELATNTLKHAETGFQVSVTVEDDAVRIEVQDGAGEVGVASDSPRTPVDWACGLSRVSPRNGVSRSGGKARLSG